MKRLPLLLNDAPSPLVKAGMYLLVPIVLAVALPILLMLIVAFYLLALFHGTRIFVTIVVGKKVEPEPEFEMQKPHFLELQSPARALPDDSQKPLP